MELYVIRHGITNTNVLKQINGVNEEDINQRGVRQANKAALFFEKIDYDLVIASPLKRTVTTANIINIKEKEMIFDDRLKERDSASMMYRDVSVVDIDSWYDMNLDIVGIDSESFKSVVARVYNFLNDLKNKYPEKALIIVTHGDVCKAIRGITRGSFEGIAKFEQDNCEIMKYKI